MAFIYKRIINERKKIDNYDMIYKITTINNEILCKSNIYIKYKNCNYLITLFYDRSYPFKSPNKILLNNINILTIYDKIMNQNSDLFLVNLYTKSITCNANWTVMLSLKTIIDEIIKIIHYKDLYIKRKLLDQIINKYSNQNLDFLHFYLL